MRQENSESCSEPFTLHERPTNGIQIVGKRGERELTTMRIMVHCYCRAHHEGISTLCEQCQNLLDYATRRLERCRFKADKPTCAKCPVHCYQSHWREEMKKVMRYAGPRMLWRHPILSLFHLWDGFRSKNIRAS